MIKEDFLVIKYSQLNQLHSATQCI